MGGWASDNIAYATRISPEGQERLCRTAGIEPPEWEDQEFPEPDTREQTRQLTGRDFDDLIEDADDLSRRPYLCSVCGGTFTIDEYQKIKGMARRNHEPNPFLSREASHEDCVR